MPATAATRPARRRPRIAMPRLLLPALALALAVAAAPAARGALPQAVDDRIKIDLVPGTRLIDVTANDTHPDGLAVRVVALTAPRDETGAAAGSLVLHDDGSLSFTLAAAGPRRIEFSYALEDSAGNRSPAADVCLGHCLTVIFAAAEDDRFTAEVGVATSLDVLANDEGEDLVMVGWSQPQPQHGADLAWDPTSETFTYTAAVLGDGEDAFTYTVEDAAGEPSTAAVIVTLSTGGTSTAEAVLVLDYCNGNPGPPTCYFRADDSTGHVGPVDLDWGDGSPVESVTRPSWFWHDYPPGETDYLVTLTVYDPQGVPDSTSLWVHAPDAPPTLGGPSYYNCTADLACTFGAIAPADVVSWYWDFGGGSPPTTQAPPFVRGFNAPGSYTVTATVTDAAGQSTSESIVANIVEVAPVILGIDVDCAPNLWCQLTAVTEDPLAVAWYHWDFGDGATASTTGNPTGVHPYAAHGRYTVELTAEGRAVTEDRFSTEIWIGEDYRIEVGTAVASPGVATVVDLANRFESPVVVIQPLAYTGSVPVVARLTEVAGDRFTVELEAAGTLATNAVAFDYLVVDEGIWQLSDGSVIEAWRLPRGVPYEWPIDLDLAEVGRAKGELWFRAPLLHFFAAPPVVLTQVQTRNEASFVNTRQRRTTRHWVDLALEEPEADATPHALETIGLVAVTPGRRTVEGFRDVDFPEDDYRLDAKVTQGIDDAWTTVTLGGPFSVKPKIYASTGTYADADSVTLRRASLTPTSVDLRLHEDRTLDNEVSHPKEKSALLAVSAAGLLRTAPLAPSSQAAPVAASDAAETPAGRAVTVLALANDFDPDLEPLSIDYASNPQHGFAEIALYPLNRGLAVTWHPPPGFIGSDSLSYRVRDSAGLVSPLQTVSLTAVDAAPGVLLERDFDDVAELSGWVTLAGVAKVEKTELRFTGDGAAGGEVLWQGGGGWSDYRVRVDLRCEEGPEREDIGLVLHHLDGDNEVRLTWQADGEQWAVERTTAGVRTTLATVDEPLDAGFFWQVTAEVDDGVLRWSTQMAGSNPIVAPPVHEVAVGGLGLGSLGLFGEGCGRFDNLTVTDLEAAP